MFHTYLCIQGQPGLHSEIQGCTEKACLEKLKMRARARARARVRETLFPDVGATVMNTIKSIIPAIYQMLLRVLLSSSHK